MKDNCNENRIWVEQRKGSLGINKSRNKETNINLMPMRQKLTYLSNKCETFLN